MEKLTIEQWIEILNSADAAREAEENSGKKDDESKLDQLI